MKHIVKGKVGDTVMLVVPPLAATFLMWLTRLNEVTVFGFLTAAGLLASAWIPYCKWKKAGERVLPIFPILSFMLWVYYPLALFWGNRRSFSGRGELSDQLIEQAMLLAAMGAVCLWIGKWTGVGRRLVARKVVDVRMNRESTWLYIRTVVLLSLVLTFTIQSSAYLFGGGGRQVLMFLASTVPIALFVLLFRKLLRHQASHGEVLLIIVFLVGRLLAGIASGWLGAGVALMITCSVVYLYERRRIPKVAIILVFGYVLFFQAGKGAFRKVFWGERVDASLSQKISFWSNESLRNWEMTLTQPTEDSWRRLADQILGRVSLLQQTAHVLEMTPDEVPYQHGRLYSYMLVTLIPRAIWPDKPSVNDSNRFYQVAYGLTDPDRLDSVSIAVGVAAESFINFGWLGPILIMIPLGIFFDYFQHTFLARDSGWVLNAVGIALIPSFLSMEHQLTQYLGGIVQCVAMILLVLWPVLRVRARQGESAPLSDVAPRVAGGLRMPVAMPRRFL